MAIDFLILALLLISFVINLLALCAFWITPGLRTTANRFTINLLIINLIGCIILAPTLFLTSNQVNNGNAIAQEEQQRIVQETIEAGGGGAAAAAALQANSIEYYAKPGNHQMTIRHNGKFVEQDGIIVRRQQSSNEIKDNAIADSADSADSAESTATEEIRTIFKCNETFCRELTIDKRSDGRITIEIKEDNQMTPETTTTTTSQPLPLGMRCWSIDMTAALGALAVLLVVGDTWCAVTDPLRYHSRISGVKTWIFIALVWAFGILFGALSAFRVLDFETDTILSKKHYFAATLTKTYFKLGATNSIFGMIYACIYFVVIILLPFGFVCGMYWRIFSEARGNGLRMRQNGSSPLLQSALNLTQHQQQQQQQLHQQQQQNATGQYTNSLCVHRHSISSASSHGAGSTSGGLQMCIDQRKSSPACLRRDSAAKVLLPTISDDGSSDGGDANSVADVECRAVAQLVTVPEDRTCADRNAAIVLTLQAASGEIKRNYSARQLPLLGTSSQDLVETTRLQGIRQVHSSPNLQKYTQLRQDSLSGDECNSAHLLGVTDATLSTSMALTMNNRQQQQRAHFIAARHASHPHHHMHHHSIAGMPSSHQHQQQHSTQHHHQHHHQNSALQIPAIHASPKALSYMSSLRHRLSNASSLFKYREESRAARISILVVIMFLVSYLPFGLLVLLQSRLQAANFQGSTQLCIFMILLANVSSPFIFAYRNKRVRRGVKRLCGLEATSSLQRQCSSSVKQNGASNQNTSTAATAALQRNSSKLSTYSTNSCKYLTPQSSVVSTYRESSPLHATLTLRPNSSCSTIINFGASREGKSSAESDDLPEEYQQTPIRTPRPKLQRGITIVEHIPITTTKFTTTKRGIFDMFFKGSKKLQSCAQGVHDEDVVAPTEV